VLQFDECTYNSKPGPITVESKLVYSCMRGSGSFKKALSTAEASMVTGIGITDWLAAHSL